MGTTVKGPYDYLKLGDWNAMCAECGRKGKASEMVQLPQGIPGAGMYVHVEHYIARNPQDFVRGIPDKMAPPWSQPEPEPTFIDFCTPNGLSAVPGYAEPGCAVPGYLSPAFDSSIP
jgi:hypothetical protein